MAAAAPARPVRVLQAGSYSRPCRACGAALTFYKLEAPPAGSSGWMAFEASARVWWSEAASVAPGAAIVCVLDLTESHWQHCTEPDRFRARFRETRPRMVAPCSTCGLKVTGEYIGDPHDPTFKPDPHRCYERRRP